MNRCPDCNKFVSLETQDPEEDNLEVSDTGTVDISMRVVRICVECGTEMKETTIDASEDIDAEWFSKHDPSTEDHGDFDVGVENAGPTESGGGRYAKNMVGFEATISITCKCGESTTLEMHGEEAASNFDDLV